MRSSCPLSCGDRFPGPYLYVGCWRLFWSQAAVTRRAEHTCAHRRRTRNRAAGGVIISTESPPTVCSGVLGVFSFLRRTATFTRFFSPTYSWEWYREPFPRWRPCAAPILCF